MKKVVSDPALLICCTWPVFQRGPTPVETLYGPDPAEAAPTPSVKAAVMAAKPTVETARKRLRSLRWFIVNRSFVSEGVVADVPVVAVAVQRTLATNSAGRLSGGRWFVGEIRRTKRVLCV